MSVVERAFGILGILAFIYAIAFFFLMLGSQTRRGYVILSGRDAAVLAGVLTGVFLFVVVWGGLWGELAWPAFLTIIVLCVLAFNLLGGLMRQYSLDNRSSTATPQVKQFSFYEPFPAFQYFVAISIFNRLEKASVAQLRKRGSDEGLYYADWSGTGCLWQMGWVFVSTNRTTCSWWNERMRQRDHPYAWFGRESIMQRPLPGETNLSRYEPVKLTIVYPVRALTNHRAARLAWALFLKGDTSHTEWRDASPDRRWSKPFQH